MKDTFAINQNDLVTLKHHSVCTSDHLTLAQFTKECEETFTSFKKKTKTPMTFSQWVNGQIVALTDCFF
jgi:hypothetical protein